MAVTSHVHNKVGFTSFSTRNGTEHHQSDGWRSDLISFDIATKWTSSKNNWKCRAICMERSADACLVLHNWQPSRPLYVSRLCAFTYLHHHD